MTNGQCTIDFNADLVCSGGSDFKNVRTRHANADGQHVLAYAAESATATIDDVGPRGWSAVSQTCGSTRLLLR